MKSIKIGMAKTDITPELNCRLYGYVDIRYGRRVLDPLSVGAVAIEQDGQRVLMMSADICTINDDDGLRDKIAEATGVNKEHIFYSCIHTHSGPTTRSSAGWGDANTEYIDKILTPKSIEAASRALESMTDAVVGIGKTESYAGVNRREVAPNGEILLGQNPDAPYDPTMTAITFKTVSGENIGTIIHFAEHPTAVGINLSITRDWPGYVIDRIEELSGAPCMYINGAQGDIGPRLSNGRTYTDEFYLEENGLIAAADAERAYLSITDFTVPELKTETAEIEYIYAPLPSVEEIDKMIEALGDPEKLYLTDITRYAQLNTLKDALLSGKEFPKGKKTVQTVLALGDLAMVPYRFEAFCQIALDLRARSPFGETLLLGLTPGSFAYLPTKEQIPYGGYEIGSFRASSVPQFDDNLADHLLNENIKLLTKLYNKK